MSRDLIGQASWSVHLQHGGHRTDAVVGELVIT
jgi:hypothetical protein